MKRTYSYRNHLFQLDLTLIGILILFGFTSCFAIYNAFNLIKFGAGTNYLIRQIFWYVVSFIGLYLMCALKKETFLTLIKKSYRYLLWALIYLFISALMVRFVHIHLPFASPVNGATSWFQIPLIGSFQPSEFMKIVLLVMVCETIEHFQQEHPVMTFKEEMKLMGAILKIVGLPILLILFQPDTGLVSIIMVFLITVLACCGLRRRYVLTLFGVIVFAIVVFFILYNTHNDWLTKVLGYRMARIEAWLNPESYIHTISNQLYTALLSMGSAGLTGFGMQANIISIPEAHTDFIFAAIGQCFGLIGTTTILLLCLLLDFAMLKNAYQTEKRSHRLMIVGLLGILVYQQCWNMAMIVGLVPITGITLPLISYGGSSTLSYFIAFALVLQVGPLSKKTVVIKPLSQYKFFKRSK